ncbi:MAG: hypothetical protein PF637_14850 [Spirochaetes bacterium]|jgi:hypothetical protein|nr:hypothetical protein [Spirochaetota bacterium]
MAKKKKEHVLFDQVERIKKNINKTDYNQKKLLQEDGNSCSHKNSANQKLDKK